MAAAEKIAKAMLAGVAGGRVFAGTRPQKGTLPAVVWNVISVVPSGRLSMGVGQGLWNARVQVDAVAGTYTAMKDTMDAVRAAMHLQSGVFDGHQVVACVLDQQTPDFADLDAQVFVQPQDFLITFYD